MNSSGQEGEDGAAMPFAECRDETEEVQKSPVVDAMAGLRRAEKVQSGFEWRGPGVATIARRRTRHETSRGGLDDHVMGDDTETVPHLQTQRMSWTKELGDEKLFIVDSNEVSRKEQTKSAWSGGGVAERR